MDHSLRSEADGRQGLRLEVHQLIEELQLLDRQPLVGAGFVEPNFVVKNLD